MSAAGNKRQQTNHEDFDDLEDFEQICMCGERDKASIRQLCEETKKLDATGTNSATSAEPKKSNTDLLNEVLAQLGEIRESTKTLQTTTEKSIRDLRVTVYDAKAASMAKIRVLDRKVEEGMNFSKATVASLQEARHQRKRHDSNIEDSQESIRQELVSHSQAIRNLSYIQEKGPSQERIFTESRSYANGIKRRMISLEGFSIQDYAIGDWKMLSCENLSGFKRISSELSFEDFTSHLTIGMEDEALVLFGGGWDKLEVKYKASKKSSIYCNHWMICWTPIMKTEISMENDRLHIADNWKGDITRRVYQRVR